MAAGGKGSRRMEMKPFASSTLWAAGNSGFSMPYKHTVGHTAKLLSRVSDSRGGVPFRCNQSTRCLSRGADSRHGREVEKRHAWRTKHASQERWGYADLGESRIVSLKSSPAKEAPQIGKETLRRLKSQFGAFRVGGRKDTIR